MSFEIYVLCDLYFKKYIASPKRQLSIAKAFMWPVCVQLILEKDAESKAWLLVSASAP